MGYPLVCMMQTFTGPDFTQLPGGLFSPSDKWKKLSSQQEHIIPPGFIAFFSIAQALARNFLLFSTVKNISALKQIKQFPNGILVHCAWQNQNRDCPNVYDAANV